MIIDRAVIQRATQTANYYRGLGLRSSPFSTSTGTNSNTTPSPSRPTSSSGGSFLARKKAIPRSRKHANSLSSNASITSGTASSGYGSGIDGYSDTYCVSPVSVGSYRGGNTFTPVNTPRSVDVYTSTSSGAASAPGTITGSIPTPQQVLASISAKVNINTNTDETSNSTGTSPSPSPGISTDEETSSPSTAYSEISSSWSDYSFVDIDKDDREYIDSPTSEPMPSRKRKADGNVLLVKEVKAAHALLSLHMQDASGSECDEADEDVSPPVSSLVGVYQQQQQQQQAYTQGLSRKRRRAST